MGVRTSRKASLFLSINLLCYVLATNATDINTARHGCRGPSTPGLPPSGGGNPGGRGGSGGSNGPPATNPGQQPRTCPRNALQLGVCVNLLGGLLGVVVGNPPTLPCCTLLAGLVDLDAAVCLCTVIRANVLGINVNAQVALTLLLNACGRSPPPGFICA